MDVQRTSFIRPAIPGVTPFLCQSGLFIRRANTSQVLKLTSFTILLFAAIPPSLGCDICGCALPHRIWEPRPGIYAGASEQFTRFDDIQIDGSKTGNDARQKLESSITQIFLGYNLSRSFGFQLNVPLLHRAFRRTGEEEIESGSVTGVGDVAFLAHWIPIRRSQGDFNFMAFLFAGLKVPTGDSARLREETKEEHENEGGLHLHPAAKQSAETVHGEAEHAEPGHASPEHVEALAPSAVHGHDLALGSGSIDGIVGARFYTQWRRIFFTGEVQYALRSEGDFEYRYANDLSWSGGPGFSVFDRHDWVLNIQCVCSGETKGKDEFRGRPAEDTAFSAVYLGPKITSTWKNHLTAELGFELPVRLWNSALQIVPSYRIRAALSWAF